MRLRIVAALLLSGTFVATPAQASRLVMVPPWFQGEESGAVSEEIARLVHEELLAQNYEVVTPARAAKAVSPNHRISCVDEACAERFAVATHSVAAVMIFVRRSVTGSGPPTNFRIKVQPEPGLVYTESASLADGPVAETVPRVLRSVMKAFERGPGPWVYVKGGPRGATVLVDDVEVGTLPGLFRVDTGTRHVKVVGQGFKSLTRTVVFGSPASSRDLEFHLEPLDLPEPPSQVAKLAAPEPPPEPPPPAKWQFPVLLSSGAVVLAAGAGVLGAGIRSHRSNGCSDTFESRSECREVPAVSSGVKIGVGSALAAVGVAAVVGSVVLLRRNRSDVRVQAGLTGSGLILRGDF